VELIGALIWKWPKSRSWTRSTKPQSQACDSGTVWISPVGCLLATSVSLARTCIDLRVLSERQSIYFIPSKAKRDLRLAQDGPLRSKHLTGGSTSS